MELRMMELADREHFRNLTMNKKRMKLLKKNMKPPFKKIKVKVDGDVIEGVDVTKQRDKYFVFLSYSGEALCNEAEDEVINTTILEKDGSVVIIIPGFKYHYCRIRKQGE